MRRSDELHRWLQQQGWRLVRRTRRGHAYYEHPEADERLLVGGAGEGRGDWNTKATAKRLVR